MKSKVKDLQKNDSPKTLLGQALNLNQKKSVKKASSELTSVNEVLKQKKVRVQIMKQTIILNNDVQQKIAQAADDLSVVNVKIAKELVVLRDIESELAEVKTNLAEVSEDLSKAEVNVETTRQLALLDALTGLANRTSFEQGLAHELIQAKRHGRNLAVLFIHIDKFKSINDSYDHGMGDHVLLTVANRLKSFVRGGDIVSRWGGDEFACLLLEIKEKSDVAFFAHELVNRIAEPCELNGTVLSITSSIGIAIYPDDGETADILFQKCRYSHV
jgi:diguanylate cyclase (GGDEF)-like protein